MKNNTVFGKSILPVLFFFFFSSVTAMNKDYSIVFTGNSEAKGRLFNVLCKRDSIDDFSVVFTNLASQQRFACTREKPLYEADVVVVVLDIKPKEVDYETDYNYYVDEARRYNASKNLIIAVNKEGVTDEKEFFEIFENYAGLCVQYGLYCFFVSAKTGEGIGCLCNCIGRCLRNLESSQKASTFEFQDKSCLLM
jgi:hypothetical protein